MAEILDFNRRRSPEPLWREALGRKLREAREERGERLVDIAERAGISTQYLSEIERGRKEPSSEMIAAVTGALGIDLADLLIGVAGQVRHFQTAQFRTEVSHSRSGYPNAAQPPTSHFHISRPAGRPAGPVLMAA
jgi:transcriptional regulator with XRE-family HTH domain